MSEPLEFREEQARLYAERKHEGKNPYPSKAAARRIAKMTSATFGGRPKEAYRCPICNQWHVGAAT